MTVAATLRSSCVNGRSGSGSGRLHTRVTANPGRTPGGTAPSRCGEGVGVRAGQQPPPPQGQTWLALGSSQLLRAHPNHPPLFSTSPPCPRSVPSLPCSRVQPRTSCGSGRIPHSRAPSQTNVLSLPSWTKRLPHALLHTLDCVSLHPAWVHAPSLTAPHRLSHSTVSLVCSSTPPEPRSSRSLTCPWCSLPCSCTRNRGGRSWQFWVSLQSWCPLGSHLSLRGQGKRPKRPPGRPHVSPDMRIPGFAGRQEPLYLPPSHPSCPTPFP